MQLNRFHVISPLALVAFSACRSPYTSSSNVDGAVVNGPLSDAIVFLDYNFNGILDANEPNTETKADGSYTLTATQSNYDIVAYSTADTIDMSTGTRITGLTLKAPFGAGVVSPTSTLMKEGGLTATEVAAVLGLPDGVDPLTFNPFDVDQNDAVAVKNALEVAKISKQITTAITSFASATEGAGASREDAFNAALNSVVDVIKAKATNSSTAEKKIDFSSPTDLDLINKQLTTKAADLKGLNTATFETLAGKTSDAVKLLNTEIKKVTDLEDSGTKSLFQSTQVLREQAKDNKVTLNDPEELEKSINNKIPENMTLSGDGKINEYPNSLVIGTLSTVDSDQERGVAFKYTLAGKDADSFSLDERTNELSLKAKPDYAAKASYEVNIITEDSGGKELLKTFKIQVEKAKAGDVIESSNAGNTNFLLIDGATSGNFDLIPVKIKSDRSGYEFDASKKTEVAFDVAADKLSESIGREPAKKADVSTSDATTAETAAKAALTPSVTITAFNEETYRTSVTDGATSKDGKLYLKFTLSDSSNDFVVGDITVTGGTLSNFTGNRTEYTAELTPSGSSKVDTTVNVAEDKFTNDYFGNTAATEFNWTYDPSSGGPTVVITAFSDRSHSTAVADGDTSNNGKLYLKFTLSDNSTDFVVGDITVTGGTLSNFTGSRTVYTAEFSPSGSSKVDTTLNVAKDKFTSDSSGNMAATEFNWTYDPDNGLKDGDVIKEVDSNGDPTGKFLLLDIDSGKYSLAPVKDNGSGTYIFEDANASSGVIKASSLSASDIVREIGTSPTGNGDTISSSNATPILKQAGITAPVHGDVIRATDSSDDPTDRLLLLNIESTKYSLIPVKKDGGNWVYDSGNSAEKVTGGSGLSDATLTREIGSTPFGTGESISDSDALPILNSAGVNVAIYGDEKGGSKAFTAGAYDASDVLANPDSDGIGWILKGVKSFGETTTANAVRSGGSDIDYFQLINSLSSPKLTGSQEYKITVVNEIWNGSDDGSIGRVRLLKQDESTQILAKDGNEYKFTADGSTDYFLEIMGENGEDAQYSMIFDIV